MKFNNKLIYSKLILFFKCGQFAVFSVIIQFNYNEIFYDAIKFVQVRKKQIIEKDPPYGSFFHTTIGGF